MSLTSFSYLSPAQVSCCSPSLPYLLLIPVLFCSASLLCFYIINITDRMGRLVVLDKPSGVFIEREDPLEQLRVGWQRMRDPIILPMLRVAVFMCALMSVMLFMERVYMAVVIVAVKLLGGKKYTKYRRETLKKLEMERDRSHPMVLVQIPMYNESEVYKLSIGAACEMSWPADKLIIQVLDDSTKEDIRAMVSLECQKWAEKGIDVRCERRENRNGYKAGALREGLDKQYVRDCEYVAIFDADFQPEADFLWRTIPFLIHNPELALVQARWKFVNANDCIMTRLQEMSLDYHFSVEQEVGSSTYSFFGFNGTAGVWRIQALMDAGGWKDRTTVEDMDLAVRASLRGWKFVFVGDLAVKNELPSTYKAYRYQQHRWSCGPANLLKKMSKEILFCEKVSIWKKFHVLYAFFFVRKIIAHWVTFFFYCVVIPACIIIQEVQLPKYIAIYIPSIITILNAICTPRSIHLLIFWILFENVMSLHRTKAAIIGLLGANRVNEWVVTEKLGRSNAVNNNTSSNKNTNTSSSIIRSIINAIANRFKPSSITTQRKPKSSIWERIHILELMMGFFLLYCGIYDLILGRDYYYIYLFLQAAAFFIMGVSYMGA